MLCPNCRQPLVAGSAFCSTCGQPIAQVNPLQEQYNQELATMQAVINHFSKKQYRYDSYDNICNDLRRDRGPSKAMLIWGCILIAFTLIFLIGSSGGFFPFFLLFGIPGIVLTICGIRKISNHRSDNDALLIEYRILATDLITHYKKFPSCPVPIEYTNPKILTLFYNQLRSGRVITIRDSIAAVVDPARKNKVREYQGQLQGALYDTDTTHKIYHHFVHYNIFR